MEDYRDIEEVELIDYLRVIWKRKGLIALITLMAILVAGAVSLWMPKVYRAEAILEIGKVLTPTPTPTPTPITSPNTLTPTPITSPDVLVEDILFKYGNLKIDGKEEKGYSINAEVIKKTPLVKITLEGPDRERLREILGRIVDEVVGDHAKKIERSIEPYMAYVERLKMDAESIEKEVTAAEERLNRTNLKEGDPEIILMAQNYILDKTRELRNIKKDIIFYSSLLKDTDSLKTRPIGGINVGKFPVRPKTKLNILIAAVTGLFFSIFLAFFVEYIEKARAGKEG